MRSLGLHAFSFPPAWKMTAHFVALFVSLFIIIIILYYINNIIFHITFRLNLFGNTIPNKFLSPHPPSLRRFLSNLLTFLFIYFDVHRSIAFCIFTITIDLNKMQWRGHRSIASHRIASHLMPHAKIFYSLK